MFPWNKEKEKYKISPCGLPDLWLVYCGQNEHNVSKICQKKKKKNNLLLTIKFHPLT
jgi:hypothetical protein